MSERQLPVTHRQTCHQSGEDNPTSVSLTLLVQNTNCCCLTAAIRHPVSVSVDPLRAATNCDFQLPQTKDSHPERNVVISLVLALKQ